jgi:hypothetical protein
MDATDRLASKLRKAYAKHDEPASPLVPWRDAADDKKDAWRAIAAAARREIGGSGI